MKNPHPELGIKIVDLHKSFGAQKVLDGVSLDIPKGKSTVIVGCSGTGKSVLIKSILGLVAPDRGEIFFEGVDMTKPKARQSLQGRFTYGMLFQGAALFDSMKIWENVAFGLIQGQGMARRPARIKAIENLERVGLGEAVAELYPSQLSGGMQKRVGLARAIATRPNFLFFDEPTTGLDPIMSDVINDLIRTIVTSLGATAISITHDMASVRKIADQVALLHQGKLIWVGPADKIDKSDNPYMTQFVKGLAQGPISSAG